MNRAKKVNNFIKTLKSENITLALAESMTCGLAAHFLATCKGTADVLKGSVVCYTPEVKTGLLSVPASMIKQYTAESKEVTRTLAKKLRSLIKADVHAAVTGLAAPGGSETPSKPVGTVFFAVTYKNTIFNQRQVFRGTPLQIREKSCLALYDFILEICLPKRRKKTSTRKQTA